jgi:cytochrome c oxidase assembly protein subunit 15
MQVTSAPQVAAAADGPVALWLWSVAAIVFLMILVGGATRLTDSGLSITEWQPILGAIPPLSDADWQAAFAKYKEIPEYKLVNKGMTLEAFKTIYWWEWGHRFLGRLIGIAFAVPLALFWASGRLRPGLAPTLVGVFALGGLQGGIGWYMVQSGLVERVDVSQYRLALHLTIAFLILGLVVWIALGLAPDARGARFRTVTARQRATALVLAGAVLLQVVLGAFVAGTKAGLSYNTWPLMDGYLVPPGLLAMEPWLINITENVATIQFNHRLLAYIVVALAVVHALSLARGQDDERVVRSGAVLAVAAVTQAGLGIATLLLAQGSIPIGLGLAHQGGGAVVWAAAVWHLYRITR